MVTGRKLLLADDSITIQKVVDLTFSDEGLEVVTVSNGQQALEKLQEFTPDIVLADVYMPEMSGYQLCEYIKRTEALSHIPVMLLVGSFEPFDEAEARRVGADDYLTKPFQSIRTLIGKVRGLLTGGSGSAERAEAATQRLAPPPEAEKENRPEADFLERSTADTAPLPDVHQEAARVGVPSREVSFADLSMDDEMIEATPASNYAAGGPGRQTVQYSANDLRDAGLTPPVESKPEPLPETVGAYAAAAPANEPSHAATVASQSQTTSQAQTVSQAERAPLASAAASPDDVLLDLGEIESPSAAATEADDFFLDLFEESPRREAASAAPFAEAVAPTEIETAPPAIEADSSSAVEESAHVEAEAATFKEPSFSAEGMAAPAAQAQTTEIYTAPTERLSDDYQVEEAKSASAETGDAAEASVSAPPSGQITLEQLSPEVIDAIARRAVEHLSARVVEQVAWEVVPQLAELLIKRRLEEEKQ